MQRGDLLAGSAFSIAAPLSEDERVLIDTDFGPLDVVRALPGVPPYVELAARAVEVEVATVSVNVCSLEDLKAMKRAASRTRDLADLEQALGSD